MNNSVLIQNAEETQLQEHGRAPITGIEAAVALAFEAMQHAEAKAARTSSGGYRARS
jgi:hypothetical protein